MISADEIAAAAARARRRRISGGREEGRQGRARRDRDAEAQPRREARNDEARSRRAAGRRSLEPRQPATTGGAMALHGRRRRRTHREARDPSQVLRSQGPLRLVRHRVDGRLDPPELRVDVCASCHPFFTGTQTSSTPPARSSGSRSAWSARPRPRSLPRPRTRRVREGPPFDSRDTVKRSSPYGFGCAR